MSFLSKKWADRNRTEKGEKNPSAQWMAGSFDANEAGKDNIPQHSHALNNIFETCANPHCTTGWLHLWRNRQVPVFEGGWNCSAACTAARMEAAVQREMDGRRAVQENYYHRIPLGLLMFEQGWITASQLHKALDAQKKAGTGKLGQWLVREQGVSEQMVTRALGLQWSCPVLPLEIHETEALTCLLPRLFMDAFGVLPLRVAAGKLLYLGFAERLDPVLALAVERISGLRVESGVVQESLFTPGLARVLRAPFPAVELVETRSEAVAAQILAKAIERRQPVESRLVRVHDFLWLRMWLRKQTGSLPAPDSIQDVICSIGAY